MRVQGGLRVKSLVSRTWARNGCDMKVGEKTDGTSVEQLRFYVQFLQSAHEWRTRFLARMEAVSLDCGLSLAETLAVIRLSTGPASVAEIAIAAAIRSNGASVLIGRLEARGLVTRQRDNADRRVVRVGLTDAGQSLAADTLLPCIGEQMDALFAPISDQERAQWLSYVQRVA